MDRHVARRLAGASTVGVLLLALAAPASAHVFVSDGATVTGGGFGTEFALMVPHGCAGAATTAIEVQIPAGVTSVKPELMPGWQIDITSTTPPAPSIAPGASFTDEQMDAMTAPIVTSIKWSGGNLPDTEYAKFWIRAVFPETPGAVAFPTIQSCGDTQVAWIEIPTAGQGPESLQNPAPTVIVVAPAASPAA